MENKTTHREYRWHWGNAQDDLCCTCFPYWSFITGECYEKDFIHHPPVMSFYIWTHFRVWASEMGCQSLKEDKEWAAIIAYYEIVLHNWRENEVGMREGADRGVTSVWCSRGPLLRSSMYSSSTCRANGGSMITLLTWWHGLMCLCWSADRNPGVSNACTLMSCAAACCHGDYHLFWALITAG